MNKHFIAILLFVFIVSIGSLSATEDTIADDNEIAVETSDFDEGILSAEDVGTFTELQDLINSDENTIILQKDYKFNASTDSTPVSGIEITKNRLIIDGNNHVIDAGGEVRVFDISAINVVLKNIKIINANYSPYRYSNNGGAIYWSGGNGQVINSTFENNYAKDVGGAIYWSSSNGQVINSTFINNTVSNGQGGAIYLANGADSFKVLNSNFTSNKAINSGGSGGAIYIKVASGLKITDSNFILNSATNGGAIRFETSDAGEITNSSFINNIAYYGGAVRFDRSERATISGSSFTQNYARSSLGGGAIYFVNSKNNAVKKSEFINNSALSKNGGAIRILTSDNVEIEDSSFISNKAAEDGGAISWENSNKGKITSSNFYDNNALNGASLRLIEGSLTISKSNFTSPENKFTIVSSGDLTLDKNILDKSNYIYLDGKSILSQVNIVVLENKTLNAFFKNTLNATIFDDNNNTVILKESYDNLKFILSNGEEINAVHLDDGLWSCEYIFDSIGTYVISATHDIFKKLSVHTATLIVRSNPDVELKVSDINYLENESIVVSLNESARGNITLSVNGKNYTFKLNDTSNTKIAIEIPNLNAGEYNVVANYSGDEYFGHILLSKTFSVAKIKSEISVNASNIDYGEVLTVLINVSDNQSGTVSVDVGGKTYKINAVGGKATLQLKNLDSGKYTLKATFLGNENYLESSDKTSFEVFKKYFIIAQDLIRGYKRGLDYEAKVIDNKGNPVSGVSVVFTINSKKYTAKTDSNGIAKIYKKLASGTYSVSVSTTLAPEDAKATLKIVPRITDNRSFTKFYNNGTHYKVRVYGDDGKPVGAGHVVTFKVHGVTYKIKTDTNGWAVRTIGLAPGKYTITATYKGFTVKDKIIVKQVLKAQNLKKKKSQTKTFKVKLLDGRGNPLAKKYVKITFKGKSYKKLTNSNGIAGLKILSKLSVGKHTIKVTYIKSTLIRKIIVNG